MAWRNVWRNRRRSAVSISAMAFALMVCVLYAGLVAGYLHGMSADLIELGVGDMQLFHPEYRERPSIYRFIENADAQVAALEKKGYRASAQLLGGGLAAAGEFNAGVQFIGIDPARYKSVSKIAERVAAGKWVDAGDEPGVVIGKQLARTLDVKVGDELVVLTQATDGSMGNELFTVRGVLSSIGAYDRAGMFMNASAFRRLLAFEAGAHQIIVRQPAGAIAADAKAEVETVAGAKTQVRTWKELYPSIATMLESTEGMIYMLFVIFYIAIGILILNSMLMAVFERVKELGVLKAIGLDPSRVVVLVLLEALIQITIAVVVGLAISLPGMWYLATSGIDVGQMGGMNIAGMSMAQIWYGIYTVQTVQAPVMLLVFMALLAVIYPAYKAATVSPVVAMRHH